MPTNTQKNVNNSKQTVVVNVNTENKKPRRKRSPPKEDVPIEQEPPVTRDTVVPPAFPRRPQPYMPNVVQIHTNNMPPPPYFEVPQTNLNIAINNLRETMENKLQDLHHSLTSHATTQEELDHANSVVASARTSFENELSSMSKSGYQHSSSSSSSSSDIPPPPPHEGLPQYRNPPSSPTDSPMQSEIYSHAPSHPSSSPRPKKINMDIQDIIDRFQNVNLEDVKSEPPSIKSETLPTLYFPSVKSEPMSSSLHGTSVLHPVSVVPISETSESSSTLPPLVPPSVKSETMSSSSGSTLPPENIRVFSNPLFEEQGVSSMASNETPVSSHGISSVASNGHSYSTQHHSSVGDASRANSLLSEYRNSASRSERSRIGSEIRGIARQLRVSGGSTESLQSVVTRINRALTSQ